jgi:hypothetical protein
VPEALQHRKIEVILRPLDDQPDQAKSAAPGWDAFFKRFSRTVDDVSPCSRDEINADRLSGLALSNRPSIPRMPDEKRTHRVIE